MIYSAKEPAIIIIVIPTKASTTVNVIIIVLVIVIVFASAALSWIIEPIVVIASIVIGRPCGGLRIIWRPVSRP